MDVLNHNVETVKQNYGKARKQADYDRSLKVLSQAKKIKPDIYTKSGFMLGLGETRQQVLELLIDLKANRVDIITIGQYLRPSPENIKVTKYYKPEEFEEIKDSLTIIHHMRDGEMIKMRCLSNQKPHSDANPVKANLEDAYLSLLNENIDTKEIINN